MKITVETTYRRLGLQEEIKMIKACTCLSSEEKRKALNKIYSLVN